MGASILLAGLIGEAESLRSATPGSYYPAVFSGIGLVVVLIVIGWHTVTVAALAGVQALARWTIDEERWRAFADRQREPTRRASRTSVGGGAVCVAALFFGVGTGESASGQMLWLEVSLVGVLGVVAFYAMRLSQRAFSAVLTKGEVLVGTSYAVINGRVHRWGGAYRQMMEVEVDEGLGLLVVTARVRSGSVARAVRHETPFPAGAEEEARELLRRYARRRRCGSSFHPKLPARARPPLRLAQEALAVDQPRRSVAVFDLNGAEPLREPPVGR